MQTFIYYINQHPLQKLSIIIALGVLIFDLLLIYLHFYTKYFKNWRYLPLIKKEFEKAFRASDYKNWKETDFPYISDPGIRILLEDKVIFPHYEFKVYTDVVISFCKKGLIPLEYVYCWGIHIQDLVSYKTLIKCWEFCISNKNRAVESSTVYNSYFNLGFHYMLGRGKKVDLAKATYLLREFLKLNDKPEEITEFLNSEDIQYRWDNEYKCIVNVK
jgi:hypothetical protein